MMSDLAFNLNGDRFDVPSNAVGWRVRKMKNKGAPEVVYGRNGQPLVLPLGADLDDLRTEVGAPGRYRLDPVGRANKPIASAPAGYVFVHDVAPATVRHPSDNVALEAMRMNTEIARAVVDRFSRMIEAMATLLRGEEPIEERPGALFVRLDSKDLVPANAMDVLPPIDPQTMAHFIAIQSALAPGEAAIMREVAEDLSAAELRTWFDELSKLSVPRAVAKVRKLISGQGKHGGAV